MDSSVSTTNEEVKGTASSPLAWKTWRMIRLISYTVGGFLLAMAVLMVLPTGNKKLRKVAMTQAAASSIISATNSFQSEYGELPAPGDGTAIKGDTVLVTNEPGGIEMINILTGRDKMKNPREVQFLMIREGKHLKDGMIHAADGTTVMGCYDSWGNPYHIVLDTDYDEVLVVTIGGKKETIRGQQGVVFSAGKDRRLGTRDDFRSW